LPTGYKKIVINTAEVLGHLTTVAMHPTGLTNIQMVEHLRVIIFMMTLTIDYINRVVRCLK